MIEEVFSQHLPFAYGRFHQRLYFFRNIGFHRCNFHCNFGGVCLECPLLKIRRYGADNFAVLIFHFLLQFHCILMYCRSILYVFYRCSWLAFACLCIRRYLLHGRPIRIAVAPCIAVVRGFWCFAYLLLHCGFCCRPFCRIHFVYLTRSNWATSVKRYSYKQYHYHEKREPSF